MAQRWIANDAAIELERGKRDGRGEEGASRGVGELAAAAPDLESEVIESVVAVREGGEDGAVVLRGLVGEEAGRLLEFFPRRGREEVAEKLRTELGAHIRVCKKIGAIDEALGAIVPGDGAEVIAEEQGLDERARPSRGPVVDRDELVPVMQIFERMAGVGFGEPVGNEEGKVEMAVVEAAIGDGGFVELVNADGNQFDLRSRMLGFKEMSFFT